MGVQSQLKASMSDSFILNDSSTRRSPQDAPSSTWTQQQPTNSNKRSSFIATNDPWQSAPPSKAPDVLPSSPPTDPWAVTNTGNVRGAAENKVLDPWASSLKHSSISVGAKLPSTNPWASDVSNVDIVQSIAPANTASTELNLFDPLKAGGQLESVQTKQDSSDLFGNWDTAVRQMYQTPSYNSAHKHANPWSTNQTVSTGTFDAPTLL